MSAVYNCEHGRYYCELCEWFEDPEQPGNRRARLKQPRTDLEAIRHALYSGQISAAEVDAQRAFERLFNTQVTPVNHVDECPAGANSCINQAASTTDQGVFENNVKAREAAAHMAPQTATVVATWDDIKELFHLLWGDNGAGRYNKPRWVALQARLWRLEAATESLGTDARENLISALRRIELPR